MGPRRLSKIHPVSTEEQTKTTHSQDVLSQIGQMIVRRMNNRCSESTTEPYMCNPVIDGAKYGDGMLGGMMLRHPIPFELFCFDTRLDVYIMG